MEIIILSHKPPYPPADGGAIATFQLAINMAEQGHKIHVLSMVTDKHPCGIEQIPNDIRQKIEFEFVHVNTKITFSGLVNNYFKSKLPYTAERFISKNFSSALVKKLNEQDFDIIQLEGLYLTPYIPLIRKETHSPIALRAHNIEYEIWKKLTLNENNLLKKLYYKSLTKRIQDFEFEAIDTYDVLVPITSADQAQFNRMGNRKKSVVIPVGVNAEEYLLPENIQPVRDVFYLGALDWIPNIEGLNWFIEKVWPVVIADYPNLQFHIAGRNASHKTRKYLQGKGIVFHGEVEDAKKFMHEHGIMVVPLFSGSGMRVKIIEAMWLGKAIVTTRLGAEGIDVLNGENILLADNVAGTYAAINNLLDNQVFLKKIEGNAMKLIHDKYSGKKLAKKLSQTYSKITS